MRVYLFCHLAISFILIGLISCDEEDPCHLLPDNSFIGDPTSCQNYIYCLKGVSMKGKCPDGLYFNFKYGSCDDPSNVECKDDECDEDTEGDFLPDPRRPRLCSAYLFCRNGIAETGNCPDGLQFDPKSNTCNYATVVKCKDEIQVCANIPDDTLLRDVDNCDKYYKCNDGLATLIPCPVNKYFNEKTGDCDDSENVDCEIVCKKTEDNVHKRNPKSCRSYYECNKGERILKKCKKLEMVKSIGNDKLDCDIQMNVDNEQCSNRCDGAKRGFQPAYETSPDLKCKKYYPCKDGKVNGGGDPYECGTDRFLDVLLQRCVPSNEILKENCVTNPNPITTSTTQKPTVPTEKPTDPTEKPTDPTVKPTDPTVKPTDPTDEPTLPTAAPTPTTEEPTLPTAAPTPTTEEPTLPTAAPTPTTEEPTLPTAAPTPTTEEPTLPTAAPTPTTEKPDDDTKT